MPARRRPPPRVDELSVVFVNDQAIRILNREYRGKDKATDVLSFSLLEGEMSEHATSLGDVVISIPTTLRQAREYGVTPTQELVRLLIHGVLHLCGYDHERVPAREVRAMQRMEDALMANGPWPKLIG